MMLVRLARCCLVGVFSRFVVFSRRRISLWVKHRVHVQLEELLTLHNHLGSAWVGSVLIIIFQCCIIFYLFCLRSESYAQCCMCHYIVHSWLYLRFILASLKFFHFSWNVSSAFNKEKIYSNYLKLYFLFGFRLMFNDFQYLFM
jgi:hypothetical protein